MLFGCNHDLMSSKIPKGLCLEGHRPFVSLLISTTYITGSQKKVMTFFLPDFELNILFYSIPQRVKI
jgi:hypothetical protein